MGSESQATPSLILIAPNVSERMGGEAIKSLQIYKALVAKGVEVCQITHSRVREEMRANYPEMDVHYIEDDWLDLLAFRCKVYPLIGSPYFMYRAAQVAKKLLRERPGVVVHYTSPISPVVPMFPIPGARVVIGPINGNIHHPAIYRARESKTEKARRILLAPMQWLHWAFFSGKQKADVIIVAGGERTYESLRMAGCRDEQFRDSLDSGVPDWLAEAPPIPHSGTNMKFVHHSRLIPYKATDLAIRAVAAARNPVELDVIGEGPELDRLRQLTNELGVADRVHFKGWTRHAQLIEQLRSYRGLVAPALAEANGIVYQEAMTLGLPVICINWGGPSLLVTPETGFAIEPVSPDQVVADLADRMDRLAVDGELAARMGQRSREVALERGFAWSDLIDRWIAIYRELAALPEPIPAGQPG